MGQTLLRSVGDLIIGEDKASKDQISQVDGLCDGVVPKED